MPSNSALTLMEPACLLPSPRSHQWGAITLTYTCFLWNSRIFPWILSWFGKYRLALRCSRSSDSSKSPISAITGKRSVRIKRSNGTGKTTENAGSGTGGGGLRIWAVLSFDCLKCVHYALYPNSLQKTFTFTPGRFPGGYSSTNPHLSEMMLQYWDLQMKCESNVQNSFYLIKLETSSPWFGREKHNAHRTYSRCT